MAAGNSFPVSQGEIWWLQVLSDRLANRFGLVITRTGVAIVLRILASLLGVLMLFYPIYEFSLYLSAGILLLSPSLMLMFLGGIVGIGLARPHKEGT